MISSFEQTLHRAGYTNISGFKAIVFLLSASSVILSVITILTNSVVIAAAFYFCILVQLADTMKNRIARNNLKEALNWPNYLDAIHSAIWSGSSFQDALLDCSKYAPPTASWAFSKLENDLEQGQNLDLCLQNLKSRLANPIADRFVEITRLAIAMGGTGYLPGLKAQASQLRLENGNWEEIRIKQNWVIASAQLAVFAPWLILLLLGSRKETADAFNSEVGLVILICGLVLSLFAFKLVRLLAKLPERKRTLVI